MNLPAWIVTDLDETLLHDDRTISERSMEAIRAIRQKGVRFAIATTRNQAYAQSYIEQLEPDAMVLSGGAIGYMGETLAYRQTIEHGHTAHLLDRFFTSFAPKDLVVDTTSGRFDRTRPIEQPFSRDVLSMFIWLHPDQAIEHLGTCDGKLEITALWQPRMYRVSHHRATKMWALRAILSEYDPKDVVCFGDDLMDVGMLGHFRGVAVANAQAQAKAAAAEITASNEEDGVARWIERL